MGRESEERKWDGGILEEFVVVRDAHVTDCAFWDARPVAASAILTFDAEVANLNWSEHVGVPCGRTL